MQEFALSVLDSLQKIHTPLLDWLMLGFTRLGEAGAIWIAITLLLLLHKKTRRCGAVCAIALLLSLLLCNLCLKPLIARPRPFTYRDVSLLVAPPMDWSFPSGHASASFAAAIGLREQGWRWSVPALVLAGLIAFSRLYLYVHFPGDVLFGALLGCFCGLAARFIVQKMDIWYNKRKAARI